MKNSIVLLATTALALYSCQQHTDTHRSVPESSPETRTAEIKMVDAVEAMKPTGNNDASNGPELTYHWSDDSYSQAHLDSLYFLAKFYIAHSENDLIKAAVKQNEQLEYSIEQQTYKGKTYDVLGIGHTSENRFTLMQWIYIDTDIRKIYEYDLPNDQLLEFPNQPMERDTGQPTSFQPASEKDIFGN